MRPRKNHGKENISMNASIIAGAAAAVFALSATATFA
jgi:hypothetical protein